MAQRLAKAGRRSRVSVSIDSMDEKIHDESGEEKTHGEELWKD